MILFESFCDEQNQIIGLIVLTDMNENTTIIGHSIAPIFISKFLVENKVKVKKLILCFLISISMCPAPCALSQRYKIFFLWQSTNVQHHGQALILMVAKDFWIEQKEWLIL